MDEFVGFIFTRGDDLLGVGRNPGVGILVGTDFRVGKFDIFEFRKSVFFGEISGILGTVVNVGSSLHINTGFSGGGFEAVAEEVFFGIIDSVEFGTGQTVFLVGSSTGFATGVTGGTLSVLDEVSVFTFGTEFGICGTTQTVEVFTTYTFSSYLSMS